MFLVFRKKIVLVFGFWFLGYWSDFFVFLVFGFVVFGFEESIANVYPHAFAEIVGLIFLFFGIWFFENTKNKNQKGTNAI